ncbi:ABC transporter permease [Dyella mobilis]|uniref:ABC transporter permease n=1 Tax=Dyella mobilis TaxID=1849582 RepID=A0ABS2KHW5_9GAMM|nr:ABC transporter permease [Dyella mobilis]MBM7130347.1 ABC transporter permease [Dyella mobilis]GLQ96973.1 ABC transporter ATP-binding protein [Dyella mobilis]
MFSYYLNLALRSLRRNIVLTSLMVSSLALGVGSCICMLTVLRLLAGDPLPGLSAHIFFPEIDPQPATGYVPGQAKPMDAFTYVDAMNLLRTRKAHRQSAVSGFKAKIVPQSGNLDPFFTNGVMATADFFPMFGVPFRYGSGWSRSDDDGAVPVVVIADYVNDKLFGGVDSVGRMVRIGERDFRVVGVLRHWAPQPRFYSGGGYGQGDGVFLPLQSALAAGMSTQYFDCYVQGDQRDLRTAPCVWLGVWLQLDSEADAQTYQAFLTHYVGQQIRQGRFVRSDVALLGLTTWLRDEQMVPEDVRQLTRLAFGFLLICVVNTVGLLLAKCLRRAREIGVRRALGASRATIFAQFMVEAGIIGLAGGVLGLAFAQLGLWAIRHEPAEYAPLAHLDVRMFAMTFAIALVSSLVAGMLPAWRACRISPAIQVKEG